MHAFIHTLTRNHRLTGDAAGQLWQIALPAPDAGALARRWLAVLGVVAGLFLGSGVIFWVAANWQDWERGLKFAGLMSLLAVVALGAAALPRLRAALLLLATLVLGGQLAFVGQTYQTGADPWQLFAAWAGLSLVGVAVSRSDAMWTFWVLLVGGGIALWSGNHLLTGALFQRWHSLGLVTPCLWAGLVWLVSAASQRALALPPPRHAYALRLAVLLAVAAWGSVAVGVVFGAFGHPVLAQGRCCLALR
jgi:uncharacterized membrane protein